ncbi:hypothetical protein SCHPADRAFT_801465, partial [Schizopora paradoxa]
LFEDQLRAFRIVEKHLRRTLAEEEVPQLLMFVPGEGGVGKSMVIQTITKLFESAGASHLLSKAAYTGIAASVIDGGTLHSTCRIPQNNGKQSAASERKLESVWAPKKYFIIDEISMV